MPSVLDDLYQRHHGLVFAAAYRVTGNAADAEDVLHTVFLRLLRRQAQDAAGIDHPESYLRRAAVNAALDVVRARRDSSEAELERLEAAGPDLERLDLGDHLRRALATLPERSAEIFVLRFLEGVPNREIAAVLGMSQIQVAVTIHRSRRKLQKQLAEWGGERRSQSAKSGA